ncbi:uncharacterized protein LOC143470572 [Clavelina lepadiformis]|uniref:uncharacterized protein LOC143470572 n=1 Tax=Clavelina lepadiformis TaxID=159417 RepID=UPI00404162A8
MMSQRNGLTSSIHIELDLPRNLGKSRRKLPSIPSNTVKNHETSTNFSTFAFNNPGFCGNQQFPESTNLRKSSRTLPTGNDDIYSDFYEDNDVIGSIIQRIRKPFCNKGSYNVSKAIAVETIYSNSENSMNHENETMQSNNDVIPENCCHLCSHQLTRGLNWIKGKIIRGGSNIQRKFCPRRDALSAGKVLYLGNISTILCGGQGSTDIAVGKIWKRSREGKIGVPMTLKFECETLALSCHHAFENKDTRSETLSPKFFVYRRLTEVCVNRHLPQILALIYRHEGQFKTVHLCCHAMLVKNKTKAKKLAKQINLRRSEAHNTHQRKINEYSNHCKGAQIMSSPAKSFSEKFSDERNLSKTKDNSRERNLFTIPEYKETL